ncbi:MAG: hypothetical protein ACAI44_18535 [Candidatus Sericytochromatia bacterium]
MHPCKALLLLLALTACSTTTPTPQPSGTPSQTPSAVPALKVSFSEVQPIIQQRCLPCHSQKPTQAGFTAPPSGVTFDTPEQIKARVSRILARAVQTKSMPQANVTGMTDAERERLRLWIEAGANL